MSLNGISSNPLLPSLNGAVRPSAVPNATNPANRAPLPTPERSPLAGDVATLRSRPSIATSPSAVPVDAPPGTDPELWSVLTSEERSFFSKTAALGPLTYGKIKNATLPAPPAMRGARLDVRA